MNNIEKDSKIDESKKESNKKLSREELKQKFRRAELQYEGRLTINDKYKKPGKVLRIDNDDYATRKYLEQLGYTPVIDPDIKVGSGSLNEPSSMGSEVHIEQGIRQSQPGILYECDQEVYEVRKEIEAENNDAMLQNKIEAAQREDQINRNK